MGRTSAVGFVRAGEGRGVNARTHVQRVRACVVHHRPHVYHVVELLYRLRRLLLARLPNHHSHSAQRVQVCWAHREALNVEPSRRQQPRHLVQHASLIVHKHSKHHPRVALRAVELHACKDGGHHIMGLLNGKGLGLTLKRCPRTAPGEMPRRRQSAGCASVKIEEKAAPTLGFARMSSSPWP